MKSFVDFKRDETSFADCDMMQGVLLDDVYIIVAGKRYRVMCCGGKYYFIVHSPKRKQPYYWHNGKKHLLDDYISYLCLGRINGYPKENGNYLELNRSKVKGAYHRWIVDHSEGYIDSRMIF